MPKIYDENGNTIYKGRGPYSRKCRDIIASKRAYSKDENDRLILFSSEGEVINKANYSSEDALERLQTEANLASDILGVGISGYELRMEVDERTYVAKLAHNMLRCVGSGLDHAQAARLFQSVISWMASMGMTVGQAEQLVESLHSMLAEMLENNQQKNPSSSSGINSTSTSIGVNCIPGPPTSTCWDELWIQAFLPHWKHPARPSVGQPEIIEVNDFNCQPQNDHSGRETWDAPVAGVWQDHVCDNLKDALNTRCFKRGSHKIIRIFLPDVERIEICEENNRWADYGHNLNYRYEDCLERFIDECRRLKADRTSTNLRLFIHRGLETEEVSL
jgi:hypothetical protein